MLCTCKMGTAASEPAAATEPVAASEPADVRAERAPYHLNAGRHLNALFRVVPVVDEVNSKQPGIGLRLIVTSEKTPTSREFTVEYGEGSTIEKFRANILSKTWYADRTTVSVRVHEQYYSRAHFWVSMSGPFKTNSDVTFRVLKPPGCIMATPLQMERRFWSQVILDLKNKLYHLPISTRDPVTNTMYPLAKAVSNIFQTVSKVNDAVPHKGEFIIRVDCTNGAIVQFASRGRVMRSNLGPGSPQGFVVVPKDEDPVDYLPGVKWQLHELPQGFNDFFPAVWRLAPGAATVPDLILLDRRINNYLRSLPQRHHLPKITKEQGVSVVSDSDSYTTMVEDTINKPRRSKAKPQPAESVALFHVGNKEEAQEDHYPAPKRHKASRRRTCRKCEKQVTY